MKKNQKGFTLIELLVVIAIIGLLSTLSIVALNSARARSRDARRVADIQNMRTALEMHYNEMNSYPATASTTSGGSIKGSGASSTYMAIIPTAPLPIDGACLASENTYTYAQTESGSSYTLKYCLGSKTGDATAGPKTATPGGMR